MDKVLFSFKIGKQKYNMHKGFWWDALYGFLSCMVGMAGSEIIILVTGFYNSWFNWIAASIFTATFFIKNANWWYKTTKKWRK